jgi:hypothetical protein
VIRGSLGSVQKPEAMCGIQFAGPVSRPMTGETVVLAIWSKDHLELGVEDELDFFRLQVKGVFHAHQNSSIRVPLIGSCQD